MSEPPSSDDQLGQEPVAQQTHTQQPQMQLQMPRVEDQDLQAVNDRQSVVQQQMQTHHQQVQHHMQFHQKTAQTKPLYFWLPLCNRFHRTSNRFCRVKSKTRSSSSRCTVSFRCMVRLNLVFMKNSKANSCKIGMRTCFTSHSHANLFSHIQCTLRNLSCL